MRHCSRVADFSKKNKPKREKFTQMATKIPKWLLNIPKWLYT
jgi:hypothetical protein